MTHFGYLDREVSRRAFAARRYDEAIEHILSSPGFDMSVLKASAPVTDTARSEPAVSVVPEPRIAEWPLFYQDWWVRASAGEELRTVTVEWDGKTVGSLNFVRRRLGGLTLLKMPPYTRTLGPILSLPASKPAAHARNLRNVVAGLFEKLPAHDRFHLFLDPEDPCAFAFAMAGCTVEQDFTFRLAADAALDRVWDGMDQKTRNLIRTVGKRVRVVQGGDGEVFIRLAAEEHHDENKHRFDAIRRIFEEGSARGQAASLVATGDDGALAGAAILVWDAGTLYYWQSSRNIAVNLPGVNSLLVWEAMKIAKEKNLRFDFDGFHSRESAIFASKFGLPPVGRPSVIHMSLRGRLAHHITSRLGRRPGI